MFIPRHPVTENQFCSYTSISGASATDGIGGTIADAGAVVYISGWDSINGRSMVEMVTASGQAPYGFLGQKVKMGYHDVHPYYWQKREDFGSSDAIANPWLYNGVQIGTKATPVMVAHDGGIWDTTHYDLTMGQAVNAGDNLYVSSNGGGKLTAKLADAVDMSTAVAISESYLSATDVAAGKKALRVKLLV
jgi:hypothetical protein